MFGGYKQITIYQLYHREKTLHIDKMLSFVIILPSRYIYLLTP